ncbi:hypothetical protein E4T66_21225 [Sinimarinibacterium sp. CAU 1509]|uniref:macro domain-containing protein n=1 Tax=Sinimarinibacterium sp. CAU 1509 TaxID=2562283 RepID=UPI0010ABA7B5|nr:macro domain-containing protein [Sinimarinibacterium sp. CAU 1509]TJY54802.1 hypothetical protein E4T66_21225 [Sinimarinibacterium sp. CAU 1509]
MQAVLSIFGAIWLLVETLDFFNVYTRDKYASYAFVIFFGCSIALAVFFRRPIQSVQVPIPHRGVCVEVRIADLFNVTGAIVISTNSVFEADVAGGKISPNSLQGQFTARYFTGNQHKLIEELRKGLQRCKGSPPYPMGTTIPITTHGKTFYLTAMSTLNSQGNASSTLRDVEEALGGLWEYVRQAGELQELAVPLMGTGRGRLNVPRSRVAELIAESFVNASAEGKISDRLVIVIHPQDAEQFSVNLYEIKDRLRQLMSL